MFHDNDLESTREHWNQIETQSGESRLSVYAPLVAQIYREHYGMVDRSNQAGSYNCIDRKTVRKQNRVLFDGIETYAVTNQHTIYLNSENLVQDLPPKRKRGREFRFDVVRVWFAVCRMAIGQQSIHYPMQASRHPPGVKAVIHSPRKGTHRPTKIDARNAKKQLRCRKCSKLTTFKCNKCGSLKHPVPLYGEKTGRNCWEDFHDSRIYHQESSQGTMFSGSTTIMMEQVK